MNVRCWVGLHDWRAVGSETVRGDDQKVRVEWQVCLRCRAMRARNRSHR